MSFPQVQRTRKGGHGADSEAGHGDGTWIFSYADLITILMIFFILMLSISNVSTEKFTALQAAMKGDSGVAEGVDPELLQSVKVSEELKKLSDEKSPTLAGIPLDAVAKKASETGGDRLAQLSAGVRILLDSVSKDFIERDIRQAAEFERLKAEVNKLDQSSQSQASSKARATEIVITLPASEVFDAQGQVTQVARSLAASLINRMSELESRPALRIETHTAEWDETFKHRQSESEARNRTLAQGALLTETFTHLGADPSLLSVAAYGFQKPLVKESPKTTPQTAARSNNRVVFLIERRPMENERALPSKPDTPD